MSSTYGQLTLAPILTPTERAIVKSYGGWTEFCLVHGLKPFKMDENEEAHRIVQAMAKYGEDKQANSAAGAK